MANKYKITQNYKIPAGVAGNYRKGYKRPEGVVIHASANPNASIDSEISYMAKNYKNAFTHAWAGHNKIIEIANTNYACWGAGGVANKRFVQIEMTEDKRLTKQQKIQVVDHAAYWAAVQLVYYGLPCTDASKGSGTVWGHTHVTKYLGGTTHTDPIAFLRSLGLTWDDVYKQTKRYYDAYKKGTSDQVKSLDGTQGTSTPKPTPSKPSKPATPSKPSSGSIVDYLNSQGKDSSFSARKKLANQYGIKNYKGTAKQNTDLLNKLKSGSKPTTSKPSTSTKNVTNYKGSSIVDYLNLKENKHLGGSSFSNRKKLASANGIKNYTGTATQNKQLLDKLQGGGASSKSTSKSVKVGDTVTTKALYANSGSTKNVRSSNIKGYVADIDNSRRNPIRLRNKKGGYYLGFTRQQDLV